MVAKKKGRPTSWQRRKQKVQSDSSMIAKKPVKRVTALQEAVAEAKAKSADARNRYRLFQPAEEGDAELAQAYSAAKAALNDYLQSQKQPQKSVGSESTSADKASKRKAAKTDTLLRPESAPVDEPQKQPAGSASQKASASPTRKASKPKAAPEPPSAASGVLFTAEALGITNAADRRLAKKHAKRARAREEKRRS